MATAKERAQRAWGDSAAPAHTDGRRGNVVVVDWNALIVGHNVAHHTQKLIDALYSEGHRITIVSSQDETCRARMLELLASHNVVSHELILRGTAVPLNSRVEFDQVRRRLGDGWFRRVVFVICGSVDMCEPFDAAGVPTFVTINKG